MRLVKRRVFDKSRSGLAVSIRACVAVLSALTLLILLAVLGFALADFLGALRFGALDSEGAAGVFDLFAALTASFVSLLLIVGLLSDPEYGNEVRLTEHEMRTQFDRKPRRTLGRPRVLRVFTVAAGVPVVAAWSIIDGLADPITQMAHATPIVEMLFVIQLILLAVYHYQKASAIASGAYRPTASPAPRRARITVRYEGRGR